MAIKTVFSNISDKYIAIMIIVFVVLVLLLL